MAEVKKSFEDIKKLILPDIDVEKYKTYIMIDNKAAELEKYQSNSGEKLATVKYEKDKDGFNVRKDEGNGILKIHTGVDLSYGKESIMTYCHPLVYSPVSGTIVKIIDTAEKKEIRILSEDKKYLHIFEHFDSIGKIYEGLFVSPGCKIGKELGRMGGTGRTGRYHYNQHVHYEIRMKSKDFTGKFSPANISEGIDNKVEEGDLMYINPEVFWNSSEETALIGFIKSKEPQMIESKDKKKIRKTVNIFRGEVVKEKKVINGKEEEVVYQFGEIEFNGKNWKTLEKGPIPNGVSWETIYKKKIKEKKDKNYIEQLFDEEIKKKTEIELMKYSVIAKEYFGEMLLNGIEIINKTTLPTIMAGKSSDDFTEENDIFIFKESKRMIGEMTKKFKNYDLKESKIALEELMTEIEDSIGENRLELKIKITEPNSKNSVFREERYVIIWSYSYIHDNVKKYKQLNGVIDWEKFDKDNLFSRAAKTKYQELLQEGADEDKIILKRIDSPEQLKKVWNEEIVSYKINELHIFSHGATYPEMNGGENPEMIKYKSREFWEKDVFVLNWNKNAKLVFYGCQTAGGAEEFSKKQKVKVIGQDGYASFSTNKTIHIPVNSFYNGSVYLYYYENLGTVNTNKEGVAYIEGTKIDN